MNGNPLQLNVPRGGSLEDTHVSGEGSSTHRSAAENAGRGGNKAGHSKSNSTTLTATRGGSVNILGTTETTTASTGAARPLTRQGTMKNMRMKKRPEKIRGKSKFRIAIFTVLAALRLQTTLKSQESALLTDYYDRAGGLKTFSRIRSALSDLGQNPDDDELTFILYTTLGWRGDGHVLSYEKFKTIFLLRKRFLRLAEAQVDDTKDTFKALGGSHEKSATIEGQKLKDSADIFGLTVDMDKILATMNKQATDEINFEEFKQMFQARLLQQPSQQQELSSSPPAVSGKEKTPRSQVMTGQSGEESISEGPPSWWMSVGDDSWWQGLEHWMEEGRHEPKQIVNREETPKQTIQGTLEELLADTTALESRRSKLLSSTTSTRRGQQHHMLGATSPPSPSNGYPPVMQASMLRKDPSGQIPMTEISENSTSTPFHYHTSGASMVISPSSADRGGTLSGELFAPSPMNNNNNNTMMGAPPTPSFLKGSAASYQLQHRGSSSIRSLGGGSSGAAGDEAFGPRTITTMEEGDDAPSSYKQEQQRFVASEQPARMEVVAAEVKLKEAELELQQARANRNQKASLIGSTAILNQFREGASQRSDGNARPHSAGKSLSEPFLDRMATDIKNKRATSAKNSKVRDKLRKERNPFDVSYKTLRPKDCFQDPPSRMKREELLNHLVNQSTSSPPSLPPQLNPRETLNRRPSFDFSRPASAAPLRQPSILRGPNVGRPSSAGATLALQDMLRGGGGGGPPAAAHLKRRPVSAMAVVSRAASVGKSTADSEAAPVSFGARNLAKWIRGGQHADRPALHPKH